MKRSDFSVFVLFLLIGTAGCSKKNERMPEPLQIGPVEEMISKKYPDYSQIEVKPLDEDRVYQAKFKSQGYAYSVITNKNTILDAARVSNGEVPQALKEKVNSLHIAGGTYSNYSYNTAIGSDGVERSYHLADYRLKGVDYTLQADQALRSVNLALRYKSKYTTTALEDLPVKIQTFMRARTKPNPVVIQGTKLNDFMKDYLSAKAELTFAKAFAYIMPDGAKLYNVNAYYFGIPLFEFWFNESSELLLTGSCDKLQKFEQTIEPKDNPQLSHTNLSASDLSLFTGNFNRDILGNLLLDTSSETWQAEYDNVKSYHILYQKSDDQSAARWTFGLDINKQVLYSFYEHSMIQ